MSKTNTTTRIRMPDSLAYGGKPPQGAVYSYDNELDGLNDYVSDSITFKKIKNLIRAVDGGDLATTLKLFEEMEEKDAHLHGVCSTRRKALGRLEWEVTSAAESQRFRGDKVLADEAATYVEQQLAGLETFKVGLKHLAKGIGPNLSVLEIVWRDASIEELVPIPSNRLTLDPQDLSVLRIETTEDRDGIAAANPKFVVHRPEACAGVNWTRSVSHALAFVYCIKLLAIADWAILNHRFGIPFLLGKHTSTDDTEKTELKKMLANFGTAGWAMFSSAVELQVVETSQRGTAPQKDLVEWAARQQSIAMLGQPLTTDTTGGTGTLAAASVHNMVRQDLLEDDIENEGDTVRNQIIKPLCIYRYRGHKVPLPTFRRVVDEPTDELKEIQKLQAAQQAGVQVPVEHAHEVTGIPKPEEGEPVLAPSPFEMGESLDEGGL